MRDMEDRRPRPAYDHAVADFATLKPVGATRARLRNAVRAFRERHALAT
jgi:hypothetical protein